MVAPCTFHGARPVSRSPLGWLLGAGATAPTTSLRSSSGSNRKSTRKRVRASPSSSVPRDPEGGDVSLSMVSGPPSASFVVSGLGRFVWSPAPNDAAADGKSHEVVFRAEDAEGATADFRVIILVFASEGETRFLTSNSRVLVLERSTVLKAPVAVQADAQTEVELALDGAPEGMALARTGAKSGELAWTPTDAQIAKKLIWNATIKADRALPTRSRRPSRSPSCPSRVAPDRWRSSTPPWANSATRATTRSRRR